MTILQAIIAALTALGGAAPLVPGQSPLAAGFEVDNVTHSPIVRVFARPEGVQQWGTPLPRSRVPAQRAGFIALPDDTICAWDVRLVYADGRVEERERVSPCERSRVVAGR